MGPVTPVSVQ